MFTPRNAITCVLASSHFVTYIYLRPIVVTVVIGSLISIQACMYIMYRVLCNYRVCMWLTTSLVALTCGKWVIYYIQCGYTLYLSNTCFFFIWSDRCISINKNPQLLICMSIYVPLLRCSYLSSNRLTAFPDVFYLPQLISL